MTSSLKVGVFFTPHSSEFGVGCSLLPKALVGNQRQPGHHHISDKPDNAKHDGTQCCRSGIRA